MHFSHKVAALGAVLALSAAPALAAGPPTSTPNNNNNPSSSNPHKLAAPGQYCKAEPKQHVAGQSGTPFSLCVKAQAKLRGGATNSTQTARKGEAKKHAAGQRGTPFSLCVSAGAKLLNDQQSSG